MSIKVVRHILGEELSDSLEQRVFSVHRKLDTYSSLIQMCFAQFKIPDGEQPNYRLRAYNVHNRIMMETYGGLEYDSLEELRIYPMKTLLLEMKSSAGQFEEYDPTRMVVKINVWREGIQALTEECLRPV